MIYAFEYENHDYDNLAHKLISYGANHQPTWAQLRKYSDKSHKHNSVYEI